MNKMDGWLECSGFDNSNEREGERYYYNDDRETAIITTEESTIMIKGQENSVIFRGDDHLLDAVMKSNNDFKAKNLN